ncbi:type II secretion system protein GspD [Halanaerobium hydrogeniformans]|uniref:Type II and III secretion system protein n=1 Tax=Halanaerobium hydrogeniformans TaxID=656519 RepID=E4RLE5_HALHG|nr:secretin N-terminal domain-containing protein [Halanaerobium hydrogeniformans]ADQ14859.1 type II and III secretion system protein [Halanaerobium hydrogeniformans]
MRDKKVIVILSLIFILVFSTGVLAGPEGMIENMNFQNAQIADVLRAIADIADVNLITDSTVTGTTSVHLRDISFQKALDLITQTNDLTYIWDNNTIVVAEPDRIERIYANIVTEFVSVRSQDIDDIAVIVREIFPETQITLDAVRRQFILKGEESRVEEVKEMINRLDSSADPDREVRPGEEVEIIERYTDSYRVLNAELGDLEGKLRQINFNLEIRSNPLTDTLTLTGSEQDVTEAISMAETYDKSLEPGTRHVRVDYVDTEQIKEVIENFYPDIRLHVNNKTKRIVINGPENRLDSVEQLVKQLNVPRQQVVIETRVEEVSEGRLRELGIEGDLSQLRIIKDDHITDRRADSREPQPDKLSLTWPEFFRALDETSDSKTLANPRLMTLNGETANMAILDEVPYRVVEINDDGSRTETFEYAEAGVDIEFTPWITENKEIELSIKPRVSSFTQVTTAAGAPPALRSREVETMLRLNDGETLAIGGLIQTDQDGVITKIPLLGDIPIIGELFKSRRNEGSHNELIIFVTPRIIEYGEEIEPEEHLIRTGLEEEAVPVEEETTVVDDSEVVTEEEIDYENDAHDDSVAEVFSERARTREEILAEFRAKQEEKEFQQLSPEELQEILNKNK